MGSTECCPFPRDTRIRSHPRLRAFFIFEGLFSQQMNPRFVSKQAKVAENLGAARLQGQRSPTGKADPSELLP